MTFDHVRPASKGGPSHRWNLMVCCRECNLMKADRTPLRWALAIVIGAWRWRLAALIRG